MRRGLRELRFASTRGRGSLERLEKLCGDRGDFIDGRFEGGFVGLGRLMKTGDFADELAGCGADIVRSDWRFEIEERFDAAAHEAPWLSEFAKRKNNNK